MMLMFLLKPVVVVVLLALVLIFRCLLCLGIGSGVLRELQSELLLEDADDEELEQAEDVEEASEELHEDVLMLDDAEWLLSLILCSKEALLLEVSLLVLLDAAVLTVLTCSSWISAPGLLK